MKETYLQVLIDSSSPFAQSSVLSQSVLHPLPSVQSVFPTWAHPPKYYNVTKFVYLNVFFYFEHCPYFDFEQNQSKFVDLFVYILEF